jgi:hypothetical protein
MRFDRRGRESGQVRLVGEYVLVGDDADTAVGQIKPVWYLVVCDYIYVANPGQVGCDAAQAVSEALCYKISGHK